MLPKITDLILKKKTAFPSGYRLMEFASADGEILPPAHPGQFVNLKINHPGVFLRRPFSICNYHDNSLLIFVKPVGKGSRTLIEMNVGEVVNAEIPLGKGFDYSQITASDKVLLAGGGIGVAPLVFLFENLRKNGVDAFVAVGGRTKDDVKDLDKLFLNSENLFFSTNDGCYGEKGLITENSVFRNDFNKIFACGPSSMLKSVAHIAFQKGIECEVSLENAMACGIGACLCCVQETVEHGNVCVCKDGPVFNIKQLAKWI